MEGIRVDVLAISPVDGRASVIVLHQPFIDFLVNVDDLNGSALLRRNMLSQTALNLVETDARQWANGSSLAGKTFLAPKWA